MTEANVALLAVGLILSVCFALDAWANFKIIRMMEKEADDLAGERKWHV